MINLGDGGIADLWKDEKSPEVQALSYALQKAVQMVIEKADQTKCFSDIDKLPESALDYFAVEMRAMYYDQNLPIEKKRGIIKNTLNWYTKAGTPSAVAEMVDVVLGSGRVVEWFDFDEPPYDPGTFDIETEAVMTADIMTELTGLIQKVKNVRSHVRRIIIVRETPSGMAAASWMFSTQESIVPNVLLGDFEASNRVYYAGHIDHSESTTVRDDFTESADASAGQSFVAVSSLEHGSTVPNHLTADSEAAESSATMALYGEVKETSTTVQ